MNFLNKGLSQHVKTSVVNEIKRQISKKGYQLEMVDPILNSIIRSEIPLDLCLSIMINPKFNWYFENDEAYWMTNKTLN